MLIFIIYWFSILVSNVEPELVERLRIVSYWVALSSTGNGVDPYLFPIKAFKTKEKYKNKR